jgi:GxxExxY protein
VKHILHKELTNEIIGTYYDVYNEIGFGFSEKVYQNFLFFELQSRGFSIEAQKQIHVYYKGRIVGEYYADIIVENKIILELKAVNQLIDEHEFQLLNYLKASKIEVGLLFNFGVNPDFKRIILTNDRKPNLK